MASLNPAPLTAAAPDAPPSWRVVLEHRTVLVGAVTLTLLALASFGSGYIAERDPLDVDPFMRLQAPSADAWFGTDALGRDVFARTLAGGQVSLVVGLTVAVLATGLGLVLGLISGYSRIADNVIMRFMDALMSLPTILFAIALTALMRASIETVIIAITVVEIPRVVRLIRSVTLSIREQPYIEAAVIGGARFHVILTKHILPNTVGPLTVQATYICASAIVIESLLSFLGAGTPPEVPSWGNIISEGRSLFQVSPWIVLIPGLFLTVTVLAVNLLGDGLRDILDPRASRRL